MAFYHQDGLVAAWSFTKRYVGTSGHVATLPEIVKLRLGARPDTNNSPWENWYTSASAEYVGVGADDRIKIIVAHGVGPMSTIDGIMDAYRWEWGDETRRNTGGRITAQQFIDLEAGVYGKVKVVNASDFNRPENNLMWKFDIAPVNVLDFREYMRVMGYVDGDNIFQRHLTAPDALRDPLLRMRLGSDAWFYLSKHCDIAEAFRTKDHKNWGCSCSWGTVFREPPYIIKAETPPNCPYTILRAKSSCERVPCIPEEGYALAHLLGVDRLTPTHTEYDGMTLISSPHLHEWQNSPKFVAMPKGAVMHDGIDPGPDPNRTIHQHWELFLQPVEEGHTPATPYRLEYVDGKWFTCYPTESSNDQHIGGTRFEFHVRSVQQIGGDVGFEADKTLLLGHKPDQVRAVMPEGANAYKIIYATNPDKNGSATVLVRFYKADVDTSRRPPLPNEIARNYSQVMEVYVQ